MTTSRSVPAAGEAGGASLWVEQLRSATPPTSNQDWDDTPFQRWYRFKEAFSPRFVADAVQRACQMLRRPVRTCLDPFGGSGTTALACQFLGVRPTTIEVNPFLGDLTEAKLSAYEVPLLVDARARLASLVGSPRSSLGRSRSAEASAAAPGPFPGAPATMVEPGVRDRWIFNAAVAERIAVYNTAFGALEDSMAERLFRVLLGSTLLGLSNVVVNGKGRRYRAPSRWHATTAADVDSAFDAAFHRAFVDVVRYADRACPGYTLLRGDARALTSSAEEADLVLFSPPYPNSFDYTDIYNVELWALGYLSSPAQNRQLRDATLRSHVQIKRDFGAASIGASAPLLAATVTRLEEVADKLWSAYIPAMVKAYFADLATVFVGARDVLAAGGVIMLVVGDSRYAGVAVDVPAIVQELAPTLGLRCVDARPVRAMRSSAQQGGAFTLSESLVTLARA